MAKRSKANSDRLKTYVYRGLLKCGECGCVITNEDHIKRQQNGNVHYYPYCRCTKKKGPCSQPCIREEELTRQIAAVVTTASLADGTADWMIERLQSERDGNAD